jgi:arylsulfatase A-like enzyme
VVAGPSASIDLAPTLLAEAGLDGSGLPGQLLGRRRADQPVFVSTDWHVVVQGTDKLVLPASGAALLFDLEADPGETVDLAAQRPERVAELNELRSAWLRSLTRPRGETVDVPLTEEEAAELRALGYLGQ